MGDPRVDLQPETAQMIRHQLCRACLPIPEFRMLVNITPPGNHFTLDLLRTLVNISIERTRPHSRSSPHFSDKKPHTKYAEPQQHFHINSSTEDYSKHRDPCSAFCVVVEIQVARTDSKSQ